MLVQIEGKCIFENQCEIGGDVYYTPDYAFWYIQNSFSGITLSNFSINYNPPDIAIDWGDGTNPENINSGINYNHTFN